MGNIVSLLNYILSELSATDGPTCDVVAPCGRLDRINPVASERGTRPHPELRSHATDTFI